MSDIRLITKEIFCCNQCPHYEGWRWQDKHFDGCFLMDKKDIWNIFKIPDWCPLPKKEEQQ